MFCSVGRRQNLIYKLALCHLHLQRPLCIVNQNGLSYPLLLYMKEKTVLIINEQVSI